MKSKAPDIFDLMKKLDDGECDDVLNSRAIEILERLAEEIQSASGQHQKSDSFQEQLEDFDAVLQDIKKRRHTHVLDRFIKRAEQLMNEGMSFE